MSTGSRSTPHPSSASTRRGRVAVIGAGIAGAAAAHVLVQAGCDVLVLEKSRGPGGRMATRHGDTGDFDHGAQYFTVRDTRFREWLGNAAIEGHVAPWPGRDGGVPGQGQRWVGTPGMNAVARALLSGGAQLRTGARVERMARDGSWRLFDAGGDMLADVDAVVVSAPAPQAVALLEPLPALARAAGRARMAPCWALRVVLRPEVSLPADSGEPESGPVAWWALNSSKPGRPMGPPHLVLHAGVAFSREQLDAEPAAIRNLLLPDLLPRLGLADADVVAVEAHRWRYARVETALGVEALHDPEGAVVAVGDWCLGPRVESAFISGIAGARRLLDAGLGRR